MTKRLFSAAECRELDRIAIEEVGIAGYELMCRAGDAALRELLRCWPRARKLSVYCGKGNNAGDGYVVARLARDLGIEVELLQLGDAASLQGDAAVAREAALAAGVDPIIVSGSVPAPCGDVVVDAMLGTGMNGPLREPFRAAAALINRSRLPVLAIDLPSGVHADTGACAAEAVRAAATVTFIGRKIGLFTGAGTVAAGKVIFADLGVGDEVRRRVAGVPLLDYPAAISKHPLPLREASAYKQALGHVVVVGGDFAMGGAPLMAAEAALRVGAGLVTVLTRPGHRSAMLARRPELMVVDADDEPLRRETLAKATTVLAGPGLGRRDWGEALLREVVALDKPLVLDADALYWLRERNLQLRAPTIITPHAGEAATLLDCSVARIGEDRLSAAVRLAQRVNGVSVLKGAGTVLATAHGDTQRVLGVCAHGNPGMASAGMGDVLGGVVAGLLAQGMDLPGAATVAVTLHSLAADRAAVELGQRSLLATDLLPAMMALLRD